MFAHESFVFAWFLRSLDQSINLVTTASNEDPKLVVIVRIGFCLAKPDIPQYVFTLCILSTIVYCMHTFLN